MAFTPAPRTTGCPVGFVVPESSADRPALAPSRRASGPTREREARGNAERSRSTARFGAAATGRSGGPLRAPTTTCPRGPLSRRAARALRERGRGSVGGPSALGHVHGDVPLLGASCPSLGLAGRGCSTTLVLTSVGLLFAAGDCSRTGAIAAE